MNRGKILVVDDEPASVKLIADWLSSQDYEVETASGGREAVEKSLESPPDVVIMDIRMPGVDGYEACRKIKGAPQTAGSRIIMITQFNDREAKLKALSSGASEFISKPVDRSELSIRVKNLLAIKASEDFLLHRTKSLEQEVRQKLMELEESFVKAKIRAGSPAAAEAVENSISCADEHLENREYEAALFELNKAASLSPDSLKIHMNRAKVYAAMNDMESAAGEYTRAVSLEPAGKKAYFNRGQCFMKMGNYRAAAEDFTKTLEIEPAHVNAHISRSIAFRNIGETGKAVRDCDSALCLAPRSAKAFNSRGNAHFEERRVEEALRDFTSAVEFDPKFAVAYFNRGNVYLALGNFEKAFDDYTRALGADPLYAAAYKKRGYVHIRNGDYGKALDDYTKAVEIDADDHDARYRRGMLYVELGDHRSALKDLSIAREAGGAAAEMDDELIE